MDIKSYLFRSKVNNVLQEVMAVTDTTNVRVYSEDGSYKLLSAKLAEIITSISTEATTRDTKIKEATDNLYNKIMGFTDGDKTIDEAYDTLKEVAAYLEAHGDVATGFTNEISTIKKIIGEYIEKTTYTSDAVVTPVSAGTLEFSDDRGFYKFTTEAELDAGSTVTVIVSHNIVTTNSTAVANVTFSDGTSASYEVIIGDETDPAATSINSLFTTDRVDQIITTGILKELRTAQVDIISLFEKNITAKSKIDTLETLVGTEAVEADPDSGIEPEAATGLFKKIEDLANAATKVEKSETNGNVKVDGKEVTVYTHPTANHIHIVDAEPTVDAMVEGDLYLQLLTTSITE